MIKIIKLISWVIVFLLYTYAIYIWWITLFPSAEARAFHHPPMTIAEKHMVKAAIKEHGDYPIRRVGVEGKYIMERRGKVIRLGGKDGTKGFK
jgi:hypothetical protein